MIQAIYRMMDELSTRRSYYRTMNEEGLDTRSIDEELGRLHEKLWKHAESVISATKDCHSMSDLDIMLNQVEHDTGYPKEFIYDVIVESYEDGEDLEEAISSSLTIAYEQDY